MRMDSTKRYSPFSPADLIELEGPLCADLAKFFKFSSHAIYFPTLLEKPRIKFIPSEGKLIIPVTHEGKYLGALLLEGVKEEEYAKISPALPSLLTLCLDNLRLKRELEKDFSTGLSREERFYAYMGERTDSIRSLLSDPSQSGTQLYKICLGMLIINWPDAIKAAKTFDYDFKNHIFEEMAKILPEVIPDEGRASILGKNEGLHEFGIFFPAAGRGYCHLIGHTILSRLESLKFHDGISKMDYGAKLVCGHALYPQDMAGEELTLPIIEQAMRLRDRARYASRIATYSNSNIVAFTKILQRGGKILEVLQGGKLRINLGLAANAREGQRFEIRDSFTNHLKGQLVIISTGVKESLAEIIFIEDAGNLPSMGDKLLIVDQSSENQKKKRAGENESSKLINIRLFSHGEFLSAFNAASENCANFVLSVCRSVTSPEHHLTGWKKLTEILDYFLQEEAVNKPHLRPKIAGKSGNNSFIFFHPDKTADECREFFLDLISFSQKNGIELACGLFEWPFLNFGKGESELCAFKALEYAQLLPSPHLGVFDSVSLTISADRKFSQGDTFGAIESYKMALLAAPANAMASNSLGVCLAGIGKLDEAKKMCSRALEDCEDDSLKAKICYNLGTIYHKLHEHKQARVFFRKCMDLDPGHIYARIWLGRLYEQKSRLSIARKLYEHSFLLAGDNTEMANLAERHLANLDMNDETAKKARESLHNNLLRDPADAAAMNMLAKTYLQNREDVTLAELFARKSANLTNSREAWLLLAQALEEQGKNEEAQKARARAENHARG